MGGPIPDSDLLFGRLVVEQGLAKPEQVEECRRLQAQLMEAGVTPLPRLGELLVRKRYLTNGQFERTMRQSTIQGPAVTPSRDSALPEEAREGERVGKYVKTKLLGSGGMGEVWKAWDTGLGRWVALKFLRGSSSDPARSSEEIARFRREAETAAKLTHPHIGAIHDATSEYIAMQYIDGEDLSRYPRHDVKALVEILRQAALAVHFAHEHGVIHRDLKPANIMIAGGHAYVMDFGLAKSMSVDSRLSASGTIIGSPAYMSPEQARGCRELGVGTDVYSLGATLYELLADHPPFAGENVYELLKKVVEEEPPAVRALNPRIAADLETIVMKCLEKEPAQRYPSALALAEDLARWLAGEAIQAHPPRTIYRARKFLQRRRAPVLIGAAGLLLAITVTAYWGSKSRREQKRQEAALPYVVAGHRIIDQMRARMCDPSYTRSGMLDLAAKAEREFERALTECPDHPEALVGIGQAYELAGDRDRALKAVDRAIAACPTFATAYLDRVRLRIDDYEALRHESKGAREETPEAKALRENLEADLACVAKYAQKNTDRLYAEGLLAFGEANYLRAEDLLAKYLESAPADAEAHYWRGHALYHLDRFQESLKEEAEALTYDARHAGAFNQRGLARNSLGDHRGAVEDYARAIEINPENAPAYSNRALAKDSLGDSKGAIEDCTRAIRIDPNYATAFASRGTIRHATGDIPGALDDLTKAISLNPKRAEYFGARGVTRITLGEFQGAIDDCTKAIALDEKMAACFAHRGAAKTRLGDYDGAIRDCTKALELDPRHVYSYLERGAARRRAGDGRGAIEDQTRAISLDSKNWEAYAHRGEVKLFLGDRQGAIEDATRAIGLNPAGWEAFDVRGMARTESADYRGAIEDATRAIELSPKNARAYVHRAETKVRTRDFEGAIADCTKASELSPKSAAPWGTQAEAKRCLRDYRGAIEDATKAIELDPKGAYFWSTRGAARSASGDYPGAISDTTQAIELNPGIAKAYSDRAGARFAAGARERAIDDATKAIELDPKSRDGYFVRGTARLALGESRGAIEDEAKAIELDPKDPFAYLIRGTAKNYVKDFTGAIADYEKALELAPKEWPLRAETELRLEKMKAGKK